MRFLISSIVWYDLSEEGTKKYTSLLSPYWRCGNNLCIMQMCLLKMRPTTIDTSGSGLWFRVLILVDPWVWKKLCWEENTHFVCAQGPWKRFVTAFARDNFIPIPWFPKKKIEYAKNGCGILYHFVHNILSVSFIIQKKRRIWFYQSWTKV